MELDVSVKLTVITNKLFIKVLTVWAIWEGIKSAKTLEGVKERVYRNGQRKTLACDNMK